MERCALGLAGSAVHLACKEAAWEKERIPALAGLPRALKAESWVLRPVGPYGIPTGTVPLPILETWPVWGGGGAARPLWESTWPGISFITGRQ